MKTKINFEFVTEFVGGFLLSFAIFIYGLLFGLYLVIWNFTQKLNNPDIDNAIVAIALVVLCKEAFAQWMEYRKDSQSPNP